MIARILNERGYTDQFGRQWQQGHITKMLKDHTYIGKIVFMRRIEKREIKNGNLVKTSFSNNPGKMVVPGLHKAIISEDLFYQAQEKRISKPAPHIRRKHSMCNPFCGLIYCGLCGQTLQLRSADGTGKRALHCRNVNCACAGAYIGLVEEKFLLYLQDWVHGYQIENSTSDDYSLSKITLQTTVSNIKREISDSQKQLSRTYDLLEQNIYTVDIFQERSETLSEKLHLLESKLSNAVSELTRIEEYELSKSQFIPKIQGIIEKYNSLDTIEAKNQLLKEVIDRIEYVKTTKGRTHADEFTLRVFPRIPKL